MEEQAEKKNSSVSKNLRPNLGISKHNERNSDSQNLAQGSDNALKAPDGGWGWLVAFGSLIICMLVLMITPCFGVLFFPFLMEMGTSSTTIAWIFNLQTFLLFMMGVIINPLSKEFGWRKVGILGCLLASSSIVLSGFAPVAEFLFFSFSFLSGFGGGLSVSICFIIVPIYFDRHRGMANAIMMAGICIGEIIGPPLIRYLQEEYGFRGATLIVGAILLNGCVGACFFHPVEWHMKKPSPKAAPEAACGVSLPLIHEDEDEMAATGSGMIPTKARRGTQKTPSGLSLNFRKTFSGVSLSNSNSGRELETSASYAKLTRVRGLFHLSECSSDSIASLYNSDFSVYTLALFGRATSPSCNEKEDMIDAGDEGSASTLRRTTLRLLRSLESDIKILRHLRAVVISLANTLIANGYFNFLMMLPFSMQAADLTLQDSALSISVAAVCNLLFRFLTSIMSDWSWFSLRAAHLGGHIVLTSAMIVFPFLLDLRWILVTMGLIGCGAGTSLGLNTLAIIDVMGLDNLPPAFAVASLMSGVGFLTFGPLIGFIRDVSGSYATSMLICSAMTFSSFILWLCIPLAAVWDNREDGKSEENAGETRMDDMTNEDKEEV
ncbi:uncharacterized protein [Panulirus ornatus]|uniref:uncharacterized protein n=1 Tax=Panulirus ornatus TaxID=150431 RepID=UPI003A8A31DA